MSSKSQPFVLKFKGNKAFSPFSNIADEEGLKRFWRVCTRVSKDLEQGERLENLSWRLWHLHSIMIDEGVDGPEERRQRKRFKLMTRGIGQGFDSEKGKELDELSIPELPPFKGVLSEDVLLERTAAPKRRTSSRSKGAAGKMAGMLGGWELDPKVGSSSSRTSSGAPTRASSMTKKSSTTGKAAGGGRRTESFTALTSARPEKGLQPNQTNDVEMAAPSSSTPSAVLHSLASPFSNASFHPTPNSTTPATTPPSNTANFQISSATSSVSHQPQRSTSSSTLNSSTMFKHPTRPPHHRASSSSVPATIPESILPPNLNPSDLQSMQQYAHLQQLNNNDPSQATHDYNALYKILPPSALQHLRPPPSAPQANDPNSTSFPNPAFPASSPNPISQLQTNASPQTNFAPPNPPDSFTDISFEELLSQLNSANSVPQQGSANANDPSALDFSSWGMDASDLGGGAGTGTGVGAGSATLGDFFNFDVNNPSHPNPAFSSNHQPMSGVEALPAQTPHAMTSATAPSPFGTSSTASLSPPSDNSKRWAGGNGTSPTQQPLPHPRVRRLSKMQEPFAGKGARDGEGGGSAIASESENEEGGHRERPSRSRGSSMPSSHHPYRNQSQSPSRARNRPTLKIPDSSELTPAQLASLVSNPLLQRQASFSNSPLRRTASPSSTSRQTPNQPNPNQPTFPNPSLSNPSYGTPTSELANSLGGMGVNTYSPQQQFNNNGSSPMSMSIPNYGNLNLASNPSLHSALLNLSNISSSPNTTGSSTPLSHPHQQQQQQPAYNQIQLHQLQQLAQLQQAQQAQQAQASYQHLNQYQLQQQLAQLAQLQAAQAAAAGSSSAQSSNHASPSTFSPSAHLQMNLDGSGGGGGSGSSGGGGGKKSSSSSSRRASDSLSSSRSSATSLRNQIRQQSYNSHLAANQTHQSHAHQQPSSSSHHGHSPYAHDFATSSSTSHSSSPLANNATTPGAASTGSSGMTPSNRSTSGKSAGGGSLKQQQSHQGQQQQQQQAPVRLSLEEQLRLAGMWNEQQGGGGVGGGGGGGIRPAGGIAMPPTLNPYLPTPQQGGGGNGGVGQQQQLGGIDFSGMMGMGGGAGPMLGGDGAGGFGMGNTGGINGGNGGWS